MDAETLVRVDFIEEAQGVWAVVHDAPKIKAFAETRQEALNKLYPAIEEYFRGRVDSVEYRVAQPQIALSKSRLRELAKKYPPPQEWHEEDLDII